MGQMLSFPLQSKGVQRRADKHYTAACVEMQGYRLTMEDMHVMELSLSKHSDIAMFGVFDGHSGTAAAAFLKEQVMAKLDALEDPTNAEDIVATMVALDQEFCKRPEERLHGSTCVFALVKPFVQDDKTLFDITVANIGDSRAMLINSKGAGAVLTQDHKPDVPEEAKRIRDAGGVVRFGRTDGELAMSRSVGDAGYKSDSKIAYSEQKVVAIPDIVKLTAEPGDILLICCDGVFEKLSNDEVAEYVYEEDQKSSTDPSVVLQGLVELSLQRGSKDNMTAMMVTFRDGSKLTYKKEEFIAGPVGPAGKKNAKFVEAYVADCKRYGLTDKEAESLIETK